MFSRKNSAPTILSSKFMLWATKKLEWVIASENAVKTVCMDIPSLFARSVEMPWTFVASSGMMKPWGLIMWHDCDRMLPDLSPCFGMQTCAQEKHNIGFIHYMIMFPYA